MSEKLTAASPFPALSWDALGGGRIDPMADGGWRLLIVYRGKHCPICRQYLKTLNGMLGDFADAGIKVYATSADPREKAEAEATEEGWSFPVGYNLQPDQMRTLGLYVSSPRSPEETDRAFSEPGMFGINPAGEAHLIDISNAAFARPDLQMVLNGLKFVMDNGFPTRGTALAGLK
ncbi:redoxin domain-containing protein [Sphingomonas sp. UYP23]